MNFSDSHPTRTLASAALLTLLAALPAAPAWSAKQSSSAESRGYQACVKQAAHQAHLVKVDSTYYIYDHSDARRYYLNGYAFQQGDSVPVKIACDTTPDGNRLLNLSLDNGQYAGRLVETVDVARN